MFEVHLQEVLHVDLAHVVHYISERRVKDTTESEKTSKEEQNGTNFSSVAPPSDTHTHTHTPGYSLYSREVFVALEGAPFPLGTTAPESETMLPLGSGSVLPRPLVLCLPGGRALTYSEWVSSYLQGGGEGEYSESSPPPPLTAVFPHFRLAVIIVYYIFQNIIHPQDPPTTG